MPLQKIRDKISQYASDGSGASIYALCCHETGEIRYIVKADDPEKRLKSHVRDARRRHSPVCNWIKKHGEPAMIILASGCSNWHSAEREAIELGRQLGLRLLNLADGGNQPKMASQKVLVSNARRATAKRPKLVMKIFRRLELNIITVEKIKGVPYEKGRNALKLFHEIVDKCRHLGSMPQLELIVSEKFKGLS